MLRSVVKFTKCPFHQITWKPLPVFVQPAAKTAPFDPHASWEARSHPFHGAVMEDPGKKLALPMLNFDTRDPVSKIVAALNAPPGRAKAVFYLARGSGTGKTRTLEEIRMALAAEGWLALIVTMNSQWELEPHEKTGKAYDDFARAVAVRMLAMFYGIPLAEVASRVDFSHTHPSAVLTLTIRHIFNAYPEKQRPKGLVLLVDEASLAQDFFAKPGKDVAPYLRTALLSSPTAPWPQALVVAGLSASIVPFTPSMRRVLFLEVPKELDPVRIVENWWRTVLPDAVLNNNEWKIALVRLAALAKRMPRIAEYFYEEFQQRGKVHLASLTNNGWYELLKEVLASVANQLQNQYAPPLPGVELLADLLFGPVNFSNEQVQQLVEVSMITNRLTAGLQVEWACLNPLMLHIAAKYHPGFPLASLLSQPLVPLQPAYIGEALEGAVKHALLVRLYVLVNVRKELFTLQSFLLNDNHAYNPALPSFLRKHLTYQFRLPAVEVSEHFLQTNIYGFERQPGQLEGKEILAGISTKELAAQRAEKYKHKALFAELMKIEATAEEPLHYINPAPGEAFDGMLLFWNGSSPFVVMFDGKSKIEKETDSSTETTGFVLGDLAQKKQAMRVRSMIAEMRKSEMQPPQNSVAQALLDGNYLYVYLESAAGRSVFDASVPVITLHREHLRRLLGPFFDTYVTCRAFMPKESYLPVGPSALPL